MSPRRSAVLLLPLLVLARASAEPGPGAFRGSALSLGAGRPVCGRATFDRKAAEAGGRVLIVDSAAAGDEQAIRLSEAVVARRGGLSSRAGAAARRHGVPAVALGQGRWDAAAPALYLDEPSFGPPQTASGLTYRAVTGTRERAVKEGDVVIVDPAAALVSLVPAEDAEARLGAAEAARAYDGLRDPQALENWLSASEGPRRGAALMEELVPRVAAGLMPVEDFARARRAAERSSAASREDMRRAESRAFARAAREARARGADCAEDAKDAGDAAALERLAEEAGAAAEGVAAASKLLSEPDLGAAAALRACRDAAARRAKARAGKPAGLDEAAAAAGADRPEGTDLPPGAWSRFVEGNGLSEWLSRTADDASLGLRRKSERVRERILSGRLEPIPGAVGPVLIVGEDASLKADGPADAAARVREAWAASWSPGPFGARLRSGRALAYEGRVRVEKIAPADVSGVAFSRDPGSGRRERVLVEASAGGLDAPEGAAPSESYALDRRTGRELSPRAGGGEKALLSPERLARVARLARALDAWKGAGVEVAFSFAGPRLLVHHARALESPRPIVPLSDPFAPRVEADQFLNVRRVGL